MVCIAACSSLLVCVVFYGSTCGVWRVCGNGAARRPLHTALLATRLVVGRSANGRPGHVGVAAALHHFLYSDDVAMGGGCSWERRLWPRRRCVVLAFGFVLKSSVCFDLALMRPQRHRPNGPPLDVGFCGR